MQKVAIDSDTIFLRSRYRNSPRFLVALRLRSHYAFTRSRETGRRYCLFRLRTRDEYTLV